jgi:chromosomal replication initiation ATPase DnaA
MFLGHLESVQSGATHIDETESRCLYLGGAAGTGKSKVLHAIKSLFEKLGKQDELLVSATTGIAEKLIQGSTIDSRC